KAVKGTPRRKGGGRGAHGLGRQRRVQQEAVRASSRGGEALPRAAGRRSEPRAHRGLREIAAGRGQQHGRGTGEEPAGGGRRRVARLDLLPRVGSSRRPFGCRTWPTSAPASSSSSASSPSG